MSTQLGRSPKHFHSLGMAARTQPDGGRDTLNYGLFGPSCRFRRECHRETLEQCQGRLVCVCGDMRVRKLRGRGKGLCRLLLAELSLSLGAGEREGVSSVN